MGVVAHQHLPAPRDRARDPHDSIRSAIDCLCDSVHQHDGLSPEAQDALAILYERYMPMVRQTVFPIVASLDDADDVTQSVFQALPRTLSRYQHGRFDAWLCRVAARTALMMLRGERRTQARWQRMMAETTREDAGHSELDDDPAVLDSLERGMREAFYRLPPAIREVVFLRAIIELSHDEIAQWLGISVAASYTRYCRGLKQLRRALSAPSLSPWGYGESLRSS